MPIQTAADSISNSAGSPYGFKNRIINGAMVIDQRNAGASITPSSDIYNLDRFRTGTSQASKLTIQQNKGSVTPPAGFANYLGMSPAATATVSSGDFFGILQLIEGYNIADFAWGSSSAKTVTLSFWVYSSVSGTYGGSINNNDGSYCYTFSYTINSTNTWEYKTVTIPGATSGSWYTNNGIGLQVFWSIGTGSTYSKTTGAWGASLSLGATGATNLMSSTSNNFYLTGVQLEKGSQATAFDWRPYGTESSLCYRYFQALGGTGGADALGIGFGAGTTVYSQGMLFQPMRAAPTISYIGSLSNLYLTTTAVGGSYSGGFTTVGTGLASYYIYGGAGSSFSTYACVHFRTNATGTYLTAASEL